MIALLSPAKKMDFDIDTSGTNFSEPLFTEDAQKIMNKLAKLSRKKIGDLMKLSANLSELNYNRYQNWALPFDKDNALQAIYAFRGDVYTGFDADSLKKKDMAYMQNHVRILSGLHGILKPLDLIQAYRLEMSTKLPVGRKKNLYEFWKEKVTAQLQEDLGTDKTIINVASNEYFKVIDKKQLDANIINFSFKENRDGKYKTIMLFAKQARGLMARYMVDHKVKDPEQLKNFDRDGYLFNEAMSSDNEWVFTR